MMSFLLTCSLLLLLLAVQSVHSFRVCRTKRKTPDRTGRKQMALAPLVGDKMGTSIASDDFVHFVGGNSNEDSFPGIQTLDFAQNSLREVIAELNEVSSADAIGHSFGPSSVQRIAEDLFLLVPFTTKAVFGFWNTSSNTVTTAPFPRTGVTEHCVMYSTTAKVAVLSGGFEASDSQKTASNTWMYLDLRDVSALKTLRWNVSESATPFYSMAHACCVLDGDGIVFGGFTNKNDRYPNHDSYRFDFDLLQWQSTKLTVKKKGKKKSGPFSQCFYRSYGVCVSDTMNFLNQSSQTTGYLVGGKTNKSSFNPTITRVKYDRFEERVKLRLAQKNGGSFFVTKKQHIGGAALLVNDSVYLVGGANKQGGLPGRYERVDVKCGRRNAHSLRHPLEGIFCVPWFVLFPLGCVCSWLIQWSMFWLTRDSLIFDEMKTKPETLVKMFASDVGVDRNQSVAEVNVQIAERYEAAIVDSLIESCGFPPELAKIVVGFAQHSVSITTLVNAVYKKRRVRLAVSRWIFYSYECVKCALLCATWAWLWVYYHDFLQHTKSPWQQSNGLWFIGCHHASAKLGADLFTMHIYASLCGMNKKKYETLEFLGIGRGFLMLAFCMWTAAISVASSIAGAVTMICFSIGAFLCSIPGLILAEDYLDFEHWNILYKKDNAIPAMESTMKAFAVALSWSGFASGCLLCTVAFAVWATDKRYDKSIWYAARGGYCESYFDFDSSDWTAWLLLVSWIL